MPEIVYDLSCEPVETALLTAGAHLRPTLICGLYSPDENQVALVRSAKGDGEELGLALKFVQGGMKPGETLPRTFEREVTEEIGLDLDAVVAVYGLAQQAPITGGRLRHGRPKIFGLVLGEVEGTPPIRPQNLKEVTLAGWYDLAEAEAKFNAQAETPPYVERGARNLLVVDGIRGLFPGRARPGYPY